MPHIDDPDFGDGQVPNRPGGELVFVDHLCGLHSLAELLDEEGAPKMLGGRTGPLAQSANGAYQSFN